MNTEDFVASRGIKAVARRVDSNPNTEQGGWGKGASHWSVELRMGRHRLTVPFSQGSALTEPPTAVDVLDCLASDASMVISGQSFEEFCSECGYDDTDSRTAERTYRIVKAQTAKLQKFLGGHGDALSELVYDVERV